MIKFKQIFLITILILACNISYSQQKNCNIITDTFFLITFDIRSKNNYPIIMSGVSKTKKFSELSKKSIDSLLESFYMNAYFTTDIYGTSNITLRKCIGDSLGYKYLKEHQLTFAKLKNSISCNNTKSEFQLNSNETVYCSIVKVGGTFWVLNKDSKDISTNSNELPLKDIKNINTCYIPYVINVVEKRKKRKN
jgi:cbb3-type cytochrome oxidase subunit 3